MWCGTVTPLLYSIFRLPLHCLTLYARTCVGVCRPHMDATIYATLSAHRSVCAVYHNETKVPFIRGLDLLLGVRSASTYSDAGKLVGFGEESRRWYNYCLRAGLLSRKWANGVFHLSLTDAGLSWVLMFEREYEAALARFSGEVGAVV